MYPVTGIYIPVWVCASQYRKLPPSTGICIPLHPSCYRNLQPSTGTCIPVWVHTSWYRCVYPGTGTHVPVWLCASHYRNLHPSMGPSIPVWVPASQYRSQHPSTGPSTVQMLQLAEVPTSFASVPVRAPTAQPSTLHPIPLSITSCPHQLCSIPVWAPHSLVGLCPPTLGPLSALTAQKIPHTRGAARPHPALELSRASSQGRAEALGDFTVPGANPSCGRAPESCDHGPQCPGPAAEPAETNK